MALIACRECQANVSTDAATCPQCGARLKPKGQTWKWVLGVPVGLVALTLLYSLTIPEYVHRAREARKLCESMGQAFGTCRSMEHQMIEEGKAAGRPASSPTKY